MNKVIMAIFPHADDVAGMCGGTLMKFAEEGCKVVLVRVTNDDKDSMSLPSKAETELANTAEFRKAATIMGVSEIVELGFVTDVLGDVSMVSLRERIVYNFRKYRPYAVFTFDPYTPYEPNLDHRRVAQAVEESTWVSNFHLHYPEHLEQGFLPHAVCERWYFARVPVDPNFVEDITLFMDRKIEAMCSHDQMVRNTLHQLQLQLKTWGRYIPEIDAAITGDLKPLIGEFLRSNAAYVAQNYGLGEGRYGEVFRVNRFGAMEAFVQARSLPLPGEPAEMQSRYCFDPASARRLFN